MIVSTDRQQTLALAGTLQCAILVQQLAKQNRFDKTALHQSTLSLIRLEETSVEEVYGGVYGVDLGLRSMVRYFTQKPDVEIREVYQYAAATHQLGLKLLGLKKTAGIIHDELEAIGSRFDVDFKSDDDSRDLEIQSALADLYSRTISFLTPRIIVQGASNRLQDPDTVSRVRSALFAGIRSAFLWHQCGGRRWHLLFNRNAYIAEAKIILSNHG